MEGIYIYYNTLKGLEPERGGICAIYGFQVHEHNAGTFENLSN